MLESLLSSFWEIQGKTTHRVHVLANSKQKECFNTECTVLTSGNTGCDAG